jgi:uncharacterized protein YndB with AHSA1/START domain
MSQNVIQISASPDTVFDVLDDADAYPRWVVGTRRIRAVDPDWPAEGSRFHHAVGNATAELHDWSRVLERSRPRHLVLEVRFRPTGVARVTIDVQPNEHGAELTIEEHPTGGPFARLPRVVTEPLLWVRNAISLQRLRHEIERRARSTGHGSRRQLTEPRSAPARRRARG